MIMNNKMEKLLNDIKENSDANLTVSKLFDLCNSRIIEWDGCILLDFNNNCQNLEDKFIPTNLINDRTQFEVLHNHIHLSDIFTELEDEPIESVKVAFILMEFWKYKLIANYPNEKFHLIVSCDEFGSVVRFYKLRQNETPWIDITKIDGFIEEAVTVTEV